MNKPCPIFLISLPRSGSTLLQRMLSISPDINTISEPWLMLPLSTMVQGNGILAIYNHKYARRAIDDFIKSLPNKHKDFYEALGAFAISLYSKTSPTENIRYFLDKTPRYYLIIPFLADIFPDAKFIFLFRHPIEVLSSIMQTWLNNRLFIYRNYVDLFYGPYALVQGKNILKNRSIKVCYGDIVNSPDYEIKRICSYLDIEFDSQMISNYNTVKLKGGMGDKYGSNSYQNPTNVPSEKWKYNINNHYRKWFVKKYVKRLGDETLAEFGSSVKEAMHEINSLPVTKKGNLKDFLYHFTSNIKLGLAIDHYKRLFRALKKGQSFFPYM